MTEAWDMEFVDKVTVVPTSWFSGVVAKLRETSVTTVGFELDENGDLEPVA